MNSNAKKYLLPRIILQSISLLLVFIPPMYKATFLFNTAYGMWTCLFRSRARLLVGLYL